MASDMDSVQDARSRLAERLASPWWYKLIAALSTASLFVAISFTLDDIFFSSAMALVVFGAIVGPSVNVAELKRRTGVAVDRYRDGLGAWYLTVFGILVVGFVLQYLLGVPYVLYVGAGVAFVATIWLEFHIDRLLRRRMEGGHGRG